MDLVKRYTLTKRIVSLTSESEAIISVANRFLFHIGLTDDWGSGDSFDGPIYITIVKESFWLERNRIDDCHLTAKYPELIEILENLYLDEDMESTFSIYTYDTSMNQREIADEMNNKMLKAGFRRNSDLDEFLNNAE